MPETLNNTPFQSKLTVMENHEGRDTAIAVVKATYAIGEDRLTVAETQAPIAFVDEYWGDPGTTSLKYASEVSLPKPFTDIVMLGHAYARGRAKTRVGLRVGLYEKTVTVYGDRVFKGLMSFQETSDPKPFSKIPLIYERAYGGWDEDKSDPEKRETCAENPVGTGFVSGRGKNSLKGMRVPNIEPCQKGLSKLWSPDRPDGFGYIAPSWKPRSDLCGTFDKAWRRERLPFMPADFNPRFYNAANPDLITREYLRGGELVSIENATPDKPLYFKLPRISLAVTFTIKGHRTTVVPNFDTLILEPDQKRFMMIYRACLDCDKQRFHVHSATIDRADSITQ